MSNKRQTKFQAKVEKKNPNIAFAKAKQRENV